MEPRQLYRGGVGDDDPSGGVASRARLALLLCFGVSGAAWSSGHPPGAQQPATQRELPASRQVATEPGRFVSAPFKSGLDTVEVKLPSSDLGSVACIARFDDGRTGFQMVPVRGNKLADGTTIFSLALGVGLIRAVECVNLRRAMDKREVAKLDTLEAARLQDAQFALLAPLRRPPLMEVAPAAPHLELTSDAVDSFADKRSVAFAVRAPSELAGAAWSALCKISIGTVQRFVRLADAPQQRHLTVEVSAAQSNGGSASGSCVLVEKTPPLPAAMAVVATATPPANRIIGGLPAEASDPGQAVRVGGNIKEPSKTKNVAPVYPDIAKQAGVQGIVILDCTISPQGRVTDVKVLRGIPLLDQAAVDAVKQWEYIPTLLDGVPVPVIMSVTVNFRLN